jgi:hypothetical protein
MHTAAASVPTDVGGSVSTWAASIGMTCAGLPSRRGAAAWSRHTRRTPRRSPASPRSTRARTCRAYGVRFRCRRSSTGTKMSRSRGARAAVSSCSNAGHTALWPAPDKADESLRPRIHYPYLPALSSCVSHQKARHSGLTATGSHKRAARRSGGRVLAERGRGLDLREIRRGLDLERGVLADPDRPRDYAAPRGHTRAFGALQQCKMPGDAGMNAQLATMTQNCMQGLEGGHGKDDREADTHTKMRTWRR